LVPTLAVTRLGRIGPGGAEDLLRRRWARSRRRHDMADADNLAKLLRYQAARVPLRLRQNGSGSQGPRGCGALAKCRRRDSNPRPADYDSR
jgi:hypothetical protein